MSFQKETPILYFNPQSSTRWSHRKYLLWPALSYRVIAPKIQKRKLNILEKAVLGICKVGTFEAIKIGEYLDIGKDLAALIILQLGEKELIEDGKLTKKGLKILAGESIEDQEMIAGYIFQDPWTGELWPRFIETLEYADVEFNQQGFPKLLLGTAGRPKNERAFMPFPVENIIETQPSPQEILDAVRKHSLALRSRHQQQTDEDEESWTFDQVPTLQRISFIEEESTPVWLTTFIYLPENTAMQINWNICDPFGLGDSLWLRRRLDKHLKKQSIRGIENMISDLIDIHKQEDENYNYSDLLDILHEQAISKVETQLTIEIRRWDDLFQSLVEMERTYLEAEELSENNKFSDKLGDVLIKAQKVAETLLLLIAENYPTRNVWIVLSEADRQGNQDLYNRLADKIGFNTPLPTALTHVKMGKVRSAADRGRSTLRPSLLAALLATRQNVKHPLYAMAQQSPELLHQLNQLAEMRDESSHSGGQKFTAQEVYRQVEIIYKFVSGMLEIGVVAKS
ncbi:hypothetical protein [Lyngbya sp. CCY1209]|uniref:hypothetical protein n=1 Tax=Lyngbya sp. CCY1209 TaxID=2886103 RepID=UPI002D1FCB03|nr:hypothetical protein [Lyngbya sp. CCY1209]MEB3882005.1 hypothetical protein [Lyngbya sp. CCY1209]